MTWTSNLSSVSTTGDHTQLAYVVSYTSDDGRAVPATGFLASSLQDVTNQITNKLAQLAARDTELAKFTALGNPTTTTGLQSSLTLAQIQALRAQVPDWTQTDATILTTLNTRNIANPVAQTNVAPVLTVTGVLGALSPASQAKLWSNPNATTVRNDVLQQNAAAVVIWANLAAAAGDITSGELTAVEGACMTPVLDPNWLSQISLADQSLGRFATEADVAAARLATG